MVRQFTRAIVRQPGTNFAAGLTSGNFGIPDYDRALAQHAAYCSALESCGLSLSRLQPDEQFADSTFVEDTALLTERVAILTRPGAESRRGETAVIETVLHDFFADVRRIIPPGTVDAGDICYADNHFFIGISQRTNPQGAEQLARLLEEFDYSSSLIDIRKMSNILHLKSGLAFLGDGHLVTTRDLSNRKEFNDFQLVQTVPGEEYAANCLLVNGVTLVAAGFPIFEHEIQQLGFRTITLEMSEFQKMDGGLSCLSLRF